MKTIKIIALLFISSLIFTSCSDSDPEVVNEEEIITTMNVMLTSSTGATVSLTSVDLDGDAGPLDPVTSDGTLEANTTYTGTIELLNELEDPAEDITEEVEEEADEHQFFFMSSGIDASFEYNDDDSNGNPVGIDFTVTTGDAGSGTMAITLVHEPTKPNDGTTANAGGETDIEVTFDITVE